MTTVALIAGALLAFWLVGSLVLRLAGGLYALWAVAGYAFDSWRVLDTVFGVVVGLAVLAAGVVLADLQREGPRADLLTALRAMRRRWSQRRAMNDDAARQPVAAEVEKRPWQELSEAELHALETAPAKHVVEVRTVAPTIHDLIAVDGSALSVEELQICDDLALDPVLVREGMAVLDAMHGDPQDIPNTLEGLLTYAEGVAVEHREWIAQRAIGPVAEPPRTLHVEVPRSPRASRTRRGHH